MIFQIFFLNTKLYRLKRKADDDENDTSESKKSKITKLDFFENEDNFKVLKVNSIFLTAY